jgi:hypothetical protein
MEGVPETEKGWQAAQDQDKEVRQAQAQFGKTWSEKPETGFSTKGESTSPKEARTLKFNNKKGRLGVRRKRTNFIVRKRVIAPYGRELPQTGVK